MYEVPQGLPDTTFVNGHLALNLALLFFKWITTEGKDRLLFSILFGVGFLLMCERAEQKGYADRLAETFFRRNLWLCLLGILHGVFLWAGDILLTYGLSGLFFLYPCRKLKARNLLLAGVLLTCASSPLLPYFLGFSGEVDLHDEAGRVAALRASGVRPTGAQEKIELQWRELEVTRAVVPPSYDGGPSGRQPYGKTVEGQAHALITELSVSRVFIVMEATGAMLLGMGLHKTGFLTGKLPRPWYWATAASGLLLSAPVYGLTLWKVYRSSFNFIVVYKWLYVPYEPLRLVSGIGMLSLMMLFIQSDRASAVKAVLADVGQTALSNYLLTSMICQWLFLWSPFALFGKLTYLEHHGVMLVVWALNIVLSSLWLRAYQLGPFEWLWRSLTYWEWLPIRMEKNDRKMGLP
jgi:uncharacterized protein